MILHAPAARCPVSVHSWRATSLSRWASAMHGAALDDQDVRVGDRLGREGVLVAHLEAENVARQVEGADLAAAVVQDLVGADRAADDLVEVLGRLVLAVDFDVAAEGHGHAHQLDRTVSGV